MLTAAALLSAPAAFAATASLTTTVDGATQVFGGDTVETAETAIGISQSGGLARNGIFEFDLSSLNDGVTINSVEIFFTLTRFVSNTGGNPAQIDLFTDLKRPAINLRHIRQL